MTKSEDEYARFWAAKVAAWTKREWVAPDQRFRTKKKFHIFLSAFPSDHWKQVDVATPGLPEMLVFKGKTGDGYWRPDEEINMLSLPVDYYNDYTDLQKCIESLDDGSDEVCSPFVEAFGDDAVTELTIDTAIVRGMCLLNTFVSKPEKYPEAIDLADKWIETVRRTKYRDDALTDSDTIRDVVCIFGRYLCQNHPGNLEFKFLEISKADIQDFLWHKGMTLPVIVDKKMRESRVLQFVADEMMDTETTIKRGLLRTAFREIDDFWR